MLASCSSDSFLRLWDPRTGEFPTSSVYAHNGAEVLSLDWNKYRPEVLATSSVDRTIKIWDLRFLGRAGGTTTGSPVNELIGHDYAVRKIAWSPHAPELLLSASYDMSARVWEDSSALKQPMQLSNMRQRGPNTGLRAVWDKHTEFVVGCDWSLWGAEGWVCTVGWDEMVWVWDVRSAKLQG